MPDKASAVPESSVVVRPEPIDSETYSVSSRLQAAGLRPAIELFEQAAAAVPLPRPPQPIVIADYGASTGHNSLLPISAALPVLRNRTRPEHSVLVVHTDVPDNNFTVLFQTLAEDPDTYLDKDPATFASAVGRSFYRQIIPSNSVHLGWSSWAIQWLSRVPAPIPDHVQVAYSADEAVRTAYAKQAAHDWHEFVAFRGRELCPGGRLVVLTMALDEHGEFGYRPLLNGLVKTLTELTADGLLTEDEVRHMCLPTVGRQEARLPGTIRAVGPFRKAVDRPPRGVRRRRPVLDAVPSRPRCNGFRRAVGRLRQGFGVSDVGVRTGGRPQRPPVGTVLRPAGKRYRGSAGRRAGTDAHPDGAAGSDQATADEMIRAASRRRRRRP